MSKCILIIILLIIAIYYYNKSKVIEGLENSDQVLQKLASIYNNDTLKVKNVEVTGQLTAPNITAKNTLTSPNITASNTLTSPNIVTYKIKPNNKDKWIDLEGQVHIFEGCTIDKAATLNNALNVVGKLGVNEIVSRTGKDIYVRAMTQFVKDIKVTDIYRQRLDGGNRNYTCLKSGDGRDCAHIF